MNPVAETGGLAVGRLLTPEEVAEQLQVQPATLQQWRWKGTGPPFEKLGAARNATVRYDSDKLAAWLETNRPRDEAT
jgi:predicted site-specific integrase-resolvase